ncbi:MULTISPECIES: helix-turn-helix transcriptional regulator [unclassified Coleofasciculus]|uniref:helix-turn-helix transcriptional regulator n=1 Tax=unclassified Coleofasciculus TaxID=2692782 RepID=UPI00187FE602|nr:MULTISPECIES: response regulator transcription factor [unclassified Coleofasciculus]MBE9128032.1 response regulator transcription factor [Coleofasciculus sp. LEGE 07081]MBE9150528.1 response regulator transcription factor [Coleofasciculus sp. LEGE 07092]
MSIVPVSPIKIVTISCSPQFLKRLEESQFFDVSATDFGLSAVPEPAEGQSKDATSMIFDDAELYVVNADLPDERAFALTRRIRKFSSKTIFILGRARSRRIVAEALAAGADAYCVKGVSPQELAEIFEVVNSKKAWIAPSNALVVEADVVSIEAPPPEYRRLVKANPLSARELQILRLVAQGYSNPQIGKELFMSPQTAKAHLRNIFRKLSVSDRLSAVVQAFRCGLFS